MKEGSNAMMKQFVIPCNIDLLIILQKGLKAVQHKRKDIQVVEIVGFRKVDVENHLFDLAENFAYRVERAALKFQLEPDDCIHSKPATEYCPYEPRPNINSVHAICHMINTFHVNEVHW